MEEKYVMALKIGAMGGLLISAAILAEMVLEIAAGGVSKDALYIAARLMSLGVYLFYVVISALAGALIVYRARELQYIGEKVTTAFAGGLVIGAMTTVALLIVSFVKPFAIVKDYGDPATNQVFNGLSGAAINVAGEAICCAPVLFTLCVVSAVIGGAVCAIAAEMMGR